MKSLKITRREFVWDRVVATAALTAGLATLTGTRTALASENDQAAVRKTRSYNPDIQD